MKKRYIIFTTLFALFITLGLFTASVIAAVRVNFGINNTISFIGGNENMAFTINAKIYGTTLGDGENAPSNTRKYNYNDSTSSILEPWDIGHLEFSAENKDNIRILYEFTIINNGDYGDYDIKAYIVPVNIEMEDLQQPTIIGTELSPIQITTNNSQGVISLEISPINSMGFEGSRTCNFNVVIEPVEN